MNNSTLSCLHYTDLIFQVARETSGQFPMCVCLPRDWKNWRLKPLCELCGRKTNEKATTLLLKHLSPCTSSNNEEVKGNASGMNTPEEDDSKHAKKYSTDNLGAYLHSTRQGILKNRSSDTFPNSYLLKSSQLEKYAYLLDIVDDTSVRTNCFTKNYSRLLEGAGSVFNPSGKQRLDVVFAEEKAKLSDKPGNLSLKHEEKGRDVNAVQTFVSSVASLNLRFFAPEEELKLMGFPSWFSFPNTVTERSRYKLIGNSINVLVVALLMIDLLHEKDSDGKCG